jgi:hypothetical protein
VNPGRGVAVETVQQNHRWTFTRLAPCNAAVRKSGGLSLGRFMTGLRGEREILAPAPRQCNSRR